MKQRITGFNILSTRLLAAVVGLIFMAGLMVIVLLSGLYHGQVMEAHIEELFLLAEHNIAEHQAGSFSDSISPGFGFAAIIGGELQAWTGDTKMIAVARTMEPERWNSGLLAQIFMAFSSALGLGGEYSFFRVAATDLLHDHLHGREGMIEEIIAVFPADMMTESMNLFFMGGVIVLLLVSLGIGLPFGLVIRQQIIQPISQLIEDMTVFSRDLYSPQVKEDLDKKSSIIGEARHALNTLQHDTRKELVQRDKLATVGEAMAKINHDMHNMLTSPVLLADSFIDSKDEEVREAAPMMIASIERAVKLCNQTLEYLKPQAPIESSLVAMAKMIGEIEGSIDIRVTYKGPDRKWLDEEQFFRLISNIVTNAATASAEKVSVTSGVENGHVVIDIADNGPGISPEIRPILFTPFEGGKRGSTGLGLAIARDIAISHGGDLQLKSTGSDGSVFSIMLPAAVLESHAA